MYSDFLRRAKKVYVLNKGIVHVMDEFFGIPDSKRSRRVSMHYFDYCNYLNYSAFCNNFAIIVLIEVVLKSTR